MRDHISMAQKADNLGFAALWMRDVPFYDPEYGDVGQVFDPVPYIAYLAAYTRNIALGTAGIVLPMREPLILLSKSHRLTNFPVGASSLGYRRATARPNIRFSALTSRRAATAFAMRLRSLRQFLSRAFRASSHRGSEALGERTT